MLRHKLFLFLIAGWFVMVAILVADKGPIATSIVLIGAFAAVFRQSTPAAFKELQRWSQEAWADFRSQSVTVVDHTSSVKIHSSSEN
ncbi:MAG: hypothetical protein NPIRA04_03330 [Nitrospirales bacterium]|nr:MAG: hypothetical protein NPIRA04_03330 [Nitrospirales bacterium]